MNADNEVAPPTSGTGSTCTSLGADQDEKQQRGGTYGPVWGLSTTGAGRRQRGAKGKPTRTAGAPTPRTGSGAAAGRPALNPGRADSTCPKARSTAPEVDQRRGDVGMVRPVHRLEDPVIAGSRMHFRADGAPLTYHRADIRRHSPPLSQRQLRWSVEGVVDEALQFVGASAEVPAGGFEGGVAEEGLDVGDVGAVLA